MMELLNVFIVKLSTAVFDTEPAQAEASDATTEKPEGSDAEEHHPVNTALATILPMFCLLMQSLLYHSD